MGDNIYEAVEHDYDWVKGQLEKEQPGKKLIFNKEMVQGIAGHYDALPRGYRHTFLIRHPLKVFASFKRMVSRFPEKLYDMHPGKVPPGYFFKEMYDLFQYIKKEGIEPEPMIIDADDLLANPKGMIKAYCEAFGISYNDSILTWPAGDEVMYSKWICQKELVMVGQVAHKSTFGYTSFGKSTPMPNRADLPDDVLKLADESMQYYNKLYEQRFKCSQ